MRISKQEIELILDYTNRVFEESRVYLFGSRMDDDKQGGDLDLYVVPKNRANLYRKKLRLRALLQERLQMPVDIVVARDESRRIEKEAKRGIAL